MTKKGNSFVFMLVATIVNILITVIIMFLGFVLVSYIATYTNNSPMIPLIMMVVFVLALLASFFIYSKLVRFVVVKFKLEDKLDPLLIKKRR